MDDIYSIPSAGNESEAAVYNQIISRLDLLDKELHETKKKQKKNKKKGKKNKKLKHILHELEMEQERTKAVLWTFVMQMQVRTQKPVWWEEAMAKSIPKIFDMGIVAVNNMTQKQPQILPANSQSQVYLTDGSDKQ